MDGQNARKYLFYAIGEILLVVIGILIALQVNNLNEQRKQEDLEHSLLLEMAQNLESDLVDLRWNINKNEELQRANELVLHQLDNRIPYHDSMEVYYGQLWGNTQLVENTSAFENLKSMGFNIISNDSLRMMITNLYSAQYDYMTNFERAADDRFQWDQFHPVFRENVRMVALGSSAYPFDPEKLMDNRDFKEVLRYNIILRQFAINLYGGLERGALALIEAINEEVEK